MRNKRLNISAYLAVVVTIHLWSSMVIVEYTYLTDNEKSPLVGLLSLSLIRNAPSGCVYRPPCLVSRFCSLLPLVMPP